MHTQDRTSSVALAVEFVASCGLFPGLCDQEMSVGILVRRFKDVLLQIIEKHHVNADHIVGIRHMKSFGFGNQSGLSCSRQFRHHDKLLAWILMVSRDISCLDRTVKMKASPPAIDVPITACFLRFRFHPVPLARCYQRRLVQFDSQEAREADCSNAQKRKNERMSN